MGYDQEEIRVVAWLSSHNDERDERDRSTFERLRREIAKMIAEDPGFAEQIQAWIV